MEDDLPELYNRPRLLRLSYLISTRCGDQGSSHIQNEVLKFNGLYSMAELNIILPHPSWPTRKPC